jgi:hypothetical protein
MEKQLLKPSTWFKEAATAVGMLAGATALAVLPTSQTSQTNSLQE